MAVKLNSVRFIIMKVHVVFFIIVFFAVFFMLLIYRYELYNSGSLIRNTKKTSNSVFVHYKQISTSHTWPSTVIIVSASTSPDNIPIILSGDTSKYARRNFRTKYNMITKPTQKFTLENSLCINKYVNYIEIPSEWKNRCPDKPVVTVAQAGRLGNQLWEYASVWSVAKSTNREAFVPNCLINMLKRIFKNLTRIPPLKYIEECPASYKRLNERDMNIESTMGSIILRPFVQLPEYVVPHLKEVRQLFEFHDDITKRSQDILRRASRGLKDQVFVSVHVRRRDYRLYLKRKRNMTLVTKDFFLRQMDYFRQKYINTLFVVVSDDPDWCERKLNLSDTVVLRGNSPEQDLSVMAQCNHTIFDYGTFGTWGAMLAGGEALLYNLSSKSKMVKLMPNWHLVT